MKELRLVSAIALALPLIAIAGCGGGGISTYGASNGAKTFTIATIATAIEISPPEPWPDAIITGYSTGSYSCNVSEDAACIVEIGYDPITDELDPGAIPSFNTGDSGEAYFGTDAWDGIWRFDAKTDPNDVGVEVCTASVTLDYNQTNGYVPLYCGSNAAGMVATPSSCFVDEGSPYNNTCTGSVTLTFPPPSSSTNSLPVATALSATNYDSSGDNLAQASVTAASTSSVVVPMPTASGTTYLVVQDASGDVLGAAEFTRTNVPPPPPPEPKCKSGGPCSNVVSANVN